MPPSKLKPSDVATEAKKTFLPYIKQKQPQYRTESYLFSDPEDQCVGKRENPGHRCRVAFIEGDPVDVALSWATEQDLEGEIPVVCMANESRPGGDWESSVVAPEENLCRRSNLYAALTNGKDHECKTVSNYPIPIRGGIYSNDVVVFRSGPTNYQIWKEMKSLPIISVAPLRRPRLQEPSRQAYSFAAERALMKDKIRAALRISIFQRHDNICIGAFGCGPVFRNPPHQVAEMFRELLFFDEEFMGFFANVVFAFDATDLGYVTDSGSSGKGKGKAGSSSSRASSESSASSLQGTGKLELDIFREVMSPGKVCNPAGY